jgi:hypothetical protein
MMPLTLTLPRVSPRSAIFAITGSKAGLFLPAPTMSVWHIAYILKITLQRRKQGSKLRISGCSCETAQSDFPCSLDAALITGFAVIWETPVKYG